MLKPCIIFEPNGGMVAGSGFGRYDYSIDPDRSCYRSLTIDHGGKEKGFTVRFTEGDRPSRLSVVNEVVFMDFVTDDTGGIGLNFILNLVNVRGKQEENVNKYFHGC